MGRLEPGDDVPRASRHRAGGGALHELRRRRHPGHAGGARGGDREGVWVRVCVRGVRAEGEGGEGERPEEGRYQAAV